MPTVTVLDHMIDSSQNPERRASPLGYIDSDRNLLKDLNVLAVEGGVYKPNSKIGTPSKAEIYDLLVWLGTSERSNPYPPLARKVLCLTREKLLNSIQSVNTANRVRPTQQRRIAELNDLLKADGVKSIKGESPLDLKKCATESMKFRSPAETSGSSGACCMPKEVSERFDQLVALIEGIQVRAPANSPASSALNTVHSTLTSLNGTVNGMNPATKLDDVMALLTPVSVAIEALSAQVTANPDQLKSLGEKIEALTPHLTALEGSLGKQLATITSHTERLVTNVDKASTSLQSQSVKLDQITKEITEMRANVKEIKEKQMLQVTEGLGKLKEQIVSLETLVTTTRCTPDVFRPLSQELDAAIKDLTGTITALAASGSPNAKARNSELQEKAAKVTELTEKLTHSTEDTGDLKAQAEAHTKKIASLEAELADLKVKSEKAVADETAKVSDLSNKSAANVAKINGLEAELAALRVNCDSELTAVDQTLEMLRKEKLLLGVQEASYKALLDRMSDPPTVDEAPLVATRATIEQYLAAVDESIGALEGIRSPATTPTAERKESLRTAVETARGAIVTRHEAYQGFLTELKEVHTKEIAACLAKVDALSLSHAEERTALEAKVRELEAQVLNCAPTSDNGRQARVAELLAVNETLKKENVALRASNAALKPIPPAVPLNNSNRNVNNAKRNGSQESVLSEAPTSLNNGTAEAGNDARPTAANAPANAPANASTTAPSPGTPENAPANAPSPGTSANAPANVAPTISSDSTETIETTVPNALPIAPASGKQDLKAIPVKPNYQQNNTLNKINNIKTARSNGSQESIPSLVLPAPLNEPNEANEPNEPNEPFLTIAPPLRLFNLELIKRNVKELMDTFKKVLTNVPTEKMLESIDYLYTTYTGEGDKRLTYSQFTYIVGHFNQYLAQKNATYSVVFNPDTSKENVKRYIEDAFDQLSNIKTAPIPRPLSVTRNARNPGKQSRHNLLDGNRTPHAASPLPSTSAASRPSYKETQFATPHSNPLRKTTGGRSKQKSRRTTRKLRR